MSEPFRNQYDDCPVRDSKCVDDCKEARDKSWKDFIADPEWKDLLVRISSSASVSVSASSASSADKLPGALKGPTTCKFRLFDPVARQVRVRIGTLPPLTFAGAQT